MDDEKLILLVQANDCIYNKYSQGYKNKEKKNSVWTQIAREMRFPEEICMKRWSSLRDRYVKEKRQSNLPSGSGSSFKYQWPLMSCMDFIAPHITSRPMRSSMNILDEMSSSDTSSPLSVEILSPDSEFAEHDSNTIRTETSPQFTQYSQSAFIEYTGSLTAPINTQPPLKEQNRSAFIAPQPGITPVPKRKRKSSEICDVDEVFSEALGVFKKLCETQKEKEKEEDSNPLHGFGKMIVATIGSMCPAKQVRAMQKVTALVMEIKLQPDE